MLVSRISMNVASVTVTAIIHGSTSPFSFRIFDSTLLMLMLMLRTSPGRLSARSAGQDGRVDVHPGPQYRFLRRDAVQHDLHGDSLHHFYEVARSVFGRQQAQPRASGAGDGVHASGKSLAVRVHLDFSFLPWPHFGQLRSEEHTSELQSQFHLVCRLLLEKKNR